MRGLYVRAFVSVLPIYFLKRNLDEINTRAICSKTTTEITGKTNRCFDKRGVKTLRCTEKLRHQFHPTLRATPNGTKRKG